MSGVFGESHWIRWQEMTIYPLRGRLDSAQEWTKKGCSKWPDQPVFACVRRVATTSHGLLKRFLSGESDRASKCYFSHPRTTRIGINVR
ncbi:MAG: hypothetical protein WAO21_14240, partial [Verrucomicrobiia bacterium]